MSAVFGRFALFVVLVLGVAGCGATGADNALVVGDESVDRESLSAYSQAIWYLSPDVDPSALGVPTNQVSADVMRQGASIAAAVLAFGEVMEERDMAFPEPDGFAGSRTSAVLEDIEGRLAEGTLTRDMPAVMRAMADGGPGFELLERQLWAQEVAVDQALVNEVVASERFGELLDEVQVESRIGVWDRFSQSVVADR